MYMLEVIFYYYRTLLRIQRSLTLDDLKSNHYEYYHKTNIQVLL